MIQPVTPSPRRSSACPMPDGEVRLPAEVLESGRSATRQVAPWRLHRADGSRPLPPRGDMLRQTRCVLFHPKDEARRPAGQKGQPQDIQPGHLSDAAPMLRRPARI